MIMVFLAVVLGRRQHCLPMLFMETIKLDAIKNTFSNKKKWALDFFFRIGNFGMKINVTLMAI